MLEKNNFFLCCRECTKRMVGCHEKCEKYATAIEENRKFRKQIKEARRDSKDFIYRLERDGREYRKH